jgi:hypothetical protein
MRGSSTHPWKFGALVRSGPDRALFDLVTPHKGSVVFATAKFHNIARLEHPPRPGCGVGRKESLVDLLAVLIPAARRDARDRSLTRSAELPAAA